MAEENEPEAPAKGGSSMMWIGIAAGASLLSAAGTFFVVSSSVTPAPEAGPSADSAAEHAEQSEPGNASHETGDSHGPPAASGSAASGGSELSNIFELETFVVNINDGNRDRFLKIKPELEITDLAVADELKARMPQVKDIIISLLSSQSFAQIRSIEGKDALREEMMIRLNALVREGKVIRVFFTEFVVQ